MISAIYTHPAVTHRYLMHRLPVESLQSARRYVGLQWLSRSVLRGLVARSAQPIHNSGTDRSLRHKSASDEVQQTCPRKLHLVPFGASDCAPRVRQTKENILIYLPGMDGTGLAVRHHIAELQEAGYRVLALRVPPGNRSDWDTMVAACASLIRHELATAGRRSDASKSHTNSSKVTVVGDSFGGVLGILLALEHPDLVDMLVLVNPATCFDKALAGVPALIAAAGLVGSIGVAVPGSFAMMQSVLAPLLFDQRRIRPEDADIPTAMLEMRSIASSTRRDGQSRDDGDGDGGYDPVLTAGAASWRMQLLQNIRIRDSQLCRIRAPTLIIASARDRLFPSLLESARLLEAIPGSRRVILPDAAHSPLLEAGVSLAQLLRNEGWTANVFNGAGQRRSSVSTITPNTRPPDVGRAVPPASPPAASQSARRRRLGAQKALSECTPTASHLKDPQNSAAQGNQGPSPPSNGQKHAWGPVSDLGTPDRPSGIALTQGEGRDGRNSAGGSRRVADPGRPGAGANHGGAARAAPLGTVSGGQAGVVAVSGTGPRYEGLTGVERAGPMAWAEWARVLGPLRFAADPVVVGRDVVDRLPWEIEGADAGHGGRRLSRSVLFVGNHTLYGFYDVPLLMLEMYVMGVELRGVAHPGHWKGPVGPFFERFGAVPATARNLSRLMKAREPVLLFPGGAREVNKRKGEEYRLLWGDQPGFVRLAAKSNAVIVPFAALGGDEAFDIQMDSGELLQSPVLGTALRSLYERFAPDLAQSMDEVVPPLPAIPGTRVPVPVPLAKPERLYFKLLDPVDPRALGAHRDTAAAEAVYRDVQSAIYRGLEELEEKRAQDPERSLLDRVRRSWMGQRQSV